MSHILHIAPLLVRWFGMTSFYCNFIVLSYTARRGEQLVSCTLSQKATKSYIYITIHWTGLTYSSIYSMNLSMNLW